MKRILTVQDISCVGRCSLTVALPIISAAGVEAGILPTAVLSNHTAFPRFTFCDLTDEIQPISDTLFELGIDFDAIYTGYLGSLRQVQLVSDFIDRYKKDDTLVVIDPAMADNGKLYYGFTEEFAAEMAKLCTKADLVIPNITEASFMLGIPTRLDYDEEHIKHVLRSLIKTGIKRAAITGVDFGDGKMGVYLYDGESDSFYSYFNKKLPVSFHGTGDIYASATVGALMRGKSIPEALKIAVDFTLASMEYTMADENHRSYGVNFEEAIPDYIELLK